ncbi:MAG: DUF362 domain-containing protein [Candidatus Omnitrophica bacterium]|nr:DUF362 domain-containing protein [Candidatus Omnitrophota bacterium]
MKSRVYFIAVNNVDTAVDIKIKLTQLLLDSRILGFVNKGSSVCIKMHFGEEGNTGFVKAEYVRLIVDYLLSKGAQPFLSDTNTLYKGRRTSSAEHLRLAAEHGFKRELIGAKVIIPDEKIKADIQEIEIGGRFIKTAKIARVFLDADVLIGIAHFKGHIMTGFGGALKNIGMGCASREGKLAQHSDLAPYVAMEKCTGCGECVKVCPVSAISLKKNKSHIDNAICIGCATCIAVCPFSAIDVHWDKGGELIQERMVEYAKSVLKDKKDSCAFINFAIKITKECDCLAKDDPRISPDIGILASQDPVSLDKACLDLVNKACGKDIFKEVHPQRNGFKQLEYAERLGLGSLDYELIQIRLSD